MNFQDKLQTNAPSIRYEGDIRPEQAQLRQQQAQAMQQMQQQAMMQQPQGRMPAGRMPPMAMGGSITGPTIQGQNGIAGLNMPGYAEGGDVENDVNYKGWKKIYETNPDAAAMNEKHEQYLNYYNRTPKAYGGIMGQDGRRQYGIGSWFQEKIMDPIKENPLLAATAAYLGYDTYQNKSDLGESILGKGLGQITKERTRKDAKGEDETYTIGGDVAGLIGKNIIPIAGGIGAGLFTKNTESDTPGLPDDTTGIQLADLKKTANLLDQKQGMAAGLNFLPTVASRKYTPAEMIDVYQTAANGGRIGFDNGGGIMMASSDMGDPKENAEYYSQRMFGKPYKELNADELEEFQEEMRRLMNKFMSNGGRINRAEGGIMDLGGMEKDYRAEGGFVPIGKAEKADDVPARLSVNEFVFTADAVRNAGGGDIDQGAKVMENMMKHLEQGGQVSEESQGMQGARDMFATSQRLGDVI